MNGLNEIEQQGIIGSSLCLENNSCEYSLAPPECMKLSDIELKDALPEDWGNN